MAKTESYKIELKGLSDGTYEYDYHLDDDFFASVEDAEVAKGDVNVQLILERLNLTFHGIAAEKTVFYFRTQILNGAANSLCLFLFLVNALAKPYLAILVDYLHLGSIHPYIELSAAAYYL